MSPEQLLKPRIKVLQPYLNSEFEVGQVIQFEEIHPYSGYSYELRDGKVVAPEYFTTYPQFRLMEWYEERSEEDLPEYLKIIIAKDKRDIGFIFKVTDYEPYDITDAIIPHESFLAYSKDIEDCIPLLLCNPSSKEEYDAFVNKSKSVTT